MAKKQKLRPPISHANLRQGYEMAVANGLRSCELATEIAQNYPDKALALAQVGQEEIGKSLTLLAAFALSQNDPQAWTWFWSGWYAHNLKAYRAFLYELLSPTRLELVHPDGTRYSGFPLRKTIPQEKEAGLYVDFDEAISSFIAPSNNVNLEDATSRTFTLMYLSLTADAVRRTLTTSTDLFRISVFGEIAFRICSEDIFQEGMPSIMESFGARSPEHKKLVDELSAEFRDVTTFLTDIVSSAKAKG